MAKKKEEESDAIYQLFGISIIKQIDKKTSSSWGIL